MGARERRDKQRAEVLAKAEALDESGAVVHVPGTWVAVETLPLGSRVRTSTGVELRIDNIGIGSVSVTVIGGASDGWRSGEQYQIAPAAILEVL